VPGVAERLSEVRARIARAARAAGRNADEIVLVAVSKTKPVELIREAHAAGQRDFGENYVQELERKAALLSDLPDLRWHVIGHVQRNKAKHVARVATWVHSVDSLRIVRELGKRRSELGELPPLRVLVEVNVGGEAQKTGCAPGELGEILAGIEAEPRLSLAGLMTVPPHTEDPAGARPYFDELVRLREREGGRARLPELSMGMTHDLEQAVAAGATMVRVGTAIFGERV
jgi:pyridoxal phosphate enzyme (YggS family)